MCLVMAEIGFFLSSEEHSAPVLVDTAARAEQAGFTTAWISDHFHPWNDEQGESSFVWSVLGAIAGQTSDLRVHTAVTCPTIRLHPGIVAQASATVATLMPGRFGLGVGSGEALNEHIFGDRWPGADLRLEMLEEAVAVIRALWTGDWTFHHGSHYRVEHAKLYSRPDTPPPIHVSGFGPKAVSLAADIGDGYMAVGPAKELVEQYRAEGGRGSAHTGLKVCWHEDRDEAVRMAHRIWPNEALPGELAQVLPTPAHFEQATQLVTPEVIADSPTPTGPDLDEHREMIQGYADAGVDELYIQQIGDEHDPFFEVYAKEILPALRS
jgi:G6PDH family F420-dependent oxidoreductase